MSVRQTYAGRHRSHPYAISSPEPLTKKAAGPTAIKSRRLPLKSISNRVQPTKSAKSTQSSLVQLHLDLLTPTKSCKICGLSYTIGSPEDEKIHKAHCARISKGMEWGKEEEKERDIANLRVFNPHLALKQKGKVGRIIAVNCNSRGKIGAKIAALLDSVNLYLSAPPLSQEASDKSRAYLFLIQEAQRERVVGVLVATRIQHALQVASAASPDQGLVHVDGGLYCHPEKLPTPMGVARLFVAASHRRMGVATALLNAAAATFIHAYPLSPERGEIAFSQPTGLGKQTMDSWGKGNVRIYEE